MSDKGGPAFREAFTEVRVLRSLVPHAKLLALTATATPSLQKMVAEALLMGTEHHMEVVRGNPDREGVFLEVLKRPGSSGPEQDVSDSYFDVLKPLIDELSMNPDHFEKTIVYLPLVWCGRAHQFALTVLASELHGLVAQFHSPQTKTLKAAIPRHMDSGTVRLIFATEALGMGADINDIRRVWHISCPTSLEIYMQEFGRAGRDGKGGRATLFFNASDIARQTVDPAMRDYCKLESCRKEFLMEYFNSSKPQTSLHSCCDNCNRSCSCDACIEKSMQALGIQAEAQPSLHISKKVRENVGLLLNNYFLEVNRNCPGMFPEAETGLSVGLAKKLTAQLEEIQATPDFLSSRYGFLDSRYLIAISAIIDTAINQ
jgi:superfamily II DNA helicase RecQ